MAIKQFEKLKPESRQRLNRLEKESGLGGRIMNAVGSIRAPFAPDDRDAQLKFRAQQRVSKGDEKRRKVY